MSSPRSPRSPVPKVADHADFRRSRSEFGHFHQPIENAAIIGSTIINKVSIYADEAWSTAAWDLMLEEVSRYVAMTRLRGHECALSSYLSVHEVRCR